MLSAHLTSVLSNWRLSSFHVSRSLENCPELATNQAENITYELFNATAKLPPNEHKLVRLEKNRVILIHYTR